MKQLKLGLLILTILLTAAVCGVPAAEAEPAQRPVHEAAPQLLTSEGVNAFVDDFVAEQMAAAHAPGLVVTIVHGGDVLLSKGYGVADVQSGRPMTPQTNLRAGSVSKPLTSLAVLELAADGRIDLDAPVSSYLPGLPLEDAYGPAGTIAQFLTLKGGYADNILQTHAPTVEEWRPLEAYLQENLPPRVHSPGIVHSYNSWEHALLGLAIAEVSGAPFEQAMENTLFRPLGMVHSTFSQPLPQSIAANLAAGHEFVDGDYKEVPLDYVNLSPGIGLVTTAEDMGRFMLALLNGGVLDGEQVLSESAVSGMLNRQEEVHPLSRGRTYGLSEISLGGRQVLYHDGNGIGHGNRLILAPEHDLGIFLSINHRPLAHDIFSGTPAYAFMKELSVALLETYLPASGQDVTLLPPLPGAADRASRFTGHYRLAGTPQGDFIKLGALLDNINVGDNGDGTIAIGSKRYVEVEPLLFQSQSNPAFYVLFIEDDLGVVSMLTFGGTGAYKKAGAYETPAVQIALVAFILLSFLAFVVIMPFSRHQSWLIWLMSLLGILFLAGLAMMMMQADLILFYKTIPPLARVLFLLPWLVGALALTYPLVLLALRRKRPSARVWLLYTVNMIAAIAFIWFVTHWNLIQF